MNSVPSKSALSLATLFLGASLALPAVFAADKPQTFTGKVSDAMCGAEHMMAGDAAACVRACVNKGSKYALVVGDKVYALDTSDKTALERTGQTRRPAGQSHRPGQRGHHRRQLRLRQPSRPAQPRPEVLISARGALFS